MTTEQNAVLADGLRHWRNLPGHIQARATAKILHAVIVEAQRIAAEHAKLEQVIQQHSLCHDLHGTVGVEDFAAGCEAEITRIYGICPWRESIKHLEAETDDL